MVFGSDALGLTLGWVGLRCVIWVQNTLNYSAPFQPVQAPRHVLAPMGHLVPRNFLFHFSTKSELASSKQVAKWRKKMSELFFRGAGMMQ